ncbi:MAG: hypothetical protein SFX73_37265 [Kofleriaceae bacterium]|nr:hypothetical protein [Kofleriaceae bacterium]
MKSVVVVVLAAAGCVEGLAPEELGLGRRVGMFPGEVSAILPPMTDALGNLYVATGVPDSTGVPQPGTAHAALSRGGWSDGCPTGTGARGGALGWIGTDLGRGWLWTRDAIVELRANDGSCETKLDVDPVSSSDLVLVAVAPLVHRDVSGRFTMAVITTGAQPTPYLATLDLELGLVRASSALGTVEVLAVGADLDAGEAAFYVRDAAGPRILLARPFEGQVGTIPVSGTADPAPRLGEIGFAADGSVAATLRSDVVAVGTRTGVTIAAAPFSVASLELDDDGGLWLTSATPTPSLARVATGQLGPARPWASAQAIDAALAAGVTVIDERGEQRAASRWKAHAAYGGSALVPPRAAPRYGLGARAVLVADPPVDRGGIPYSELAVVPVGVALP